MEKIKTLSSQELLENPWFKIRQDEVEFSNGNPGTYNVVVPRNQAVGVLPLHDDQTVTLVRQYRYPLQEFTWEIPEGGSPPDEDFEITARRELAEETGLRCERLKSLGTMHTSNCMVAERGYLFLAEGLTQGETQLDSNEVIECQRFTLKEAIAMAQDSRIVDSLSVVALLRLAAMIDEAE